jgi:hypothetical protein
MELKLCIKFNLKLVGNPWLRHSSHLERSFKLYYLHDHVTTRSCYNTSV